MFQVVVLICNLDMQIVKFASFRIMDFVSMAFTDLFWQSCQGF